MKTTILLFIAFMTSGFAMTEDQEVNKNDSLRDKKLDLLEKLESGKTILPEDIWSSFGDNYERDITREMDFTVVISHDDMEILKEFVRHDLESIRHEISGLKISDEFIKAMDELRKGGEEIRRELEKIREEIRNSDRLSVEWENS